MLNREIAETIVTETMKRVRQNINIMNIEGEIIASGDPTRVGRRHEGALEVIRTGKPLIVDLHNQGDWKGSQRGINYPIVFLQQIVGCLGITGQPEDVAEFGELVKMTTELMLNQLELSSRQEWRKRTMDTVIEELVKSNANSAKLNELIQLLQISLNPPFHVWILQTEKSLEFNPLLVRKIEDMFGDRHLLSTMENPHRAIFIIYSLTEQQIAAKSETLLNSVSRQDFPFRIGCSSSVETLDKIACVFREAQYALKLGNKAEIMAAYAGLEPLTIVHLSDLEVKERFIEHISSVLSPAALETLKVFFAGNLNIHKAAEALYIHKNTLIYRLKKIKETTGYDPQTFRDAASLQMALWIIEAGGS